MEEQFKKVIDTFELYGRGRMNEETLLEIDGIDKVILYQMEKLGKLIDLSKKTDLYKFYSLKI